MSYNTRPNPWGIGAIVCDGETEIAWYRSPDEAKRVADTYNRAELALRDAQRRLFSDDETEVARASHDIDAAKAILAPAWEARRADDRFRFRTE